MGEMWNANKILVENPALSLEAELRVEGRIM